MTHSWLLHYFIAQLQLSTTAFHTSHQILKLETSAVRLLLNELALGRAVTSLSYAHRCKRYWNGSYRKLRNEPSAQSRWEQDPFAKGSLGCDADGVLKRLTLDAVERLDWGILGSGLIEIRLHHRK